MRGGAESYCDSSRTIALHSFLPSALIALTSSVKVSIACPRIIVCERKGGGVNTV